jgi:hypothetical protein
MIYVILRQFAVRERSLLLRTVVVGAWTVLRAVRCEPSAVEWACTASGLGAVTPCLLRRACRADDLSYKAGRRISIGISGGSRCRNLAAHSHRY